MPLRVQLAGLNPQQDGRLLDAFGRVLNSDESQATRQQVEEWVAIKIEEILLQDAENEGSKDVNDTVRQDMENEGWTRV